MQMLLDIQNLQLSIHKFVQRYVLSKESKLHKKWFQQKASRISAVCPAAQTELKSKAVNLTSSTKFSAVQLQPVNLKATIIQSASLCKLERQPFEY